MMYKAPLCPHPWMEGIAQTETNVEAGCWSGRVSHCSCELIQKKTALFYVYGFEPQLNVFVNDWGAIVAWLPSGAASQACSPWAVTNSKFPERVGIPERRFHSEMICQCCRTATTSKLVFQMAMPKNLTIISAS